MQIKELIKKINKKTTFCPGPGSITEYNILGQKNSFGRNDPEYKKIENFVTSKLKKISGKKNLVTFQGSGTLAIELMMLNFLTGNIIIISTGYYSERIYNILKHFQMSHKICKSIKKIEWKEIYNSKFKSKCDWVIACPTETSKALLLPIKDLSKFAKKNKAKLMLDATGSIGLEKDHSLASVLSFSSCKGIFGFTGAAFIGYDIDIIKSRKLSFYQDLNTHIQKKVTGPYNTILSLYHVMKNFNKLKSSVLINKKLILKQMKKYLSYSKKHQPNLCTYIDKDVKIKKNKKVVLYLPRVKTRGTVISHLGELYLGSKAKGNILKKIKFI